jgi:Pirin
VVVPFHDAPTCAMRELHESRGIRHRSCSRRSASDGAILASGVGQAVAHLAASLSVVMLLVSPNQGHEGAILPGDVQWMTAGRGLIHNEIPAEGVTVHILQLWGNLPAADKMTAPRCQDLAGDAVPVRRQPGVEIRVFSGASGGLTADEEYCAHHNGRNSARPRRPSSPGSPRGLQRGNCRPGGRGRYRR